MKNLFQILVAALFATLVSADTFAQVTAVAYQLEKSKESGYYDCYLFISEGFATTTKQRIQFNSQVSLVVPKGTEIELVKSYMPIQDNQLYKGTTAMEWELAKPLLSPAPSPDHNFYAFRPVLFPSCFYNDLKQGDRVKLFTFKVTPSGAPSVRFFENEVDPGPDQPGMMGRDFSNGFCIGGTAQLFKGIMK
ncbi:MAG: hypothetical protein IPN29_15530 [Saprospiraceae bacterium]|nr:hypothetical protein [Saprospiraceae bacterium]